MSAVHWRLAVNVEVMRTVLSLFDAHHVRV